MSSVKKVNVLLLVAMLYAGTIFSASEELDKGEREGFSRHKSARLVEREEEAALNAYRAGVTVLGQVLDQRGKERFHSFTLKEDIPWDGILKVYPRDPSVQIEEISAIPGENTVYCMMGGQRAGSDFALELCNVSKNCGASDPGIEDAPEGIFLFKRKMVREQKQKNSYKDIKEIVVLLLESALREDDAETVCKVSFFMEMPIGEVIGECGKMKKITPLMNAAFYGRPKIAACLLNEGADVNAQMPDGTTALMQAVTMGREEVTTLLLKAVADVNLEDQNGHTALTIALCNRQADVARQLVAYGAQRPTPEQLASWTKNLSPAEKANIQKIVCAVFKS